MDRGFLYLILFLKVRKTDFVSSTFSYIGGGAKSEN